jgi:hypothetical protein
LQDCCLCNDNIAIQEHWLDNYGISKLGMIIDEFSHFGVSVMAERLSTGLMTGRPFEGCYLFMA